MYVGEKIKLRSFEKVDIERAQELYNDFELRAQLETGIILPLSMEEEEDFVLGQHKQKPNSYQFAMETLTTNKFIGGCGYFNYSPKNRKCSISIAILDKSYWRKGYGTDAMTVFRDFLFNELNIRKITLGVMEYNEVAISFYQKFGFATEGQLREEVYRGGKYHDKIIMSLFRN